MPTFTTELILLPPVGAPLETVTLDLSNHVQKRVEKFIYTDVVKEESVPLMFLENTPLNAWANVQIVNRTYNIGANSTRMIDDRRTIIKFDGRNYSSVYSKIVATNKTFVDEKNQVKPLFYKHVLPVGVKEVELNVYESGNKLTVETGYTFDPATGLLFTNYKNMFDPDTGSYKLFFVSYIDADGEAQHELLSPVSVAAEATWEDIDPSTGRLRDGLSVYTVSRSGSGYSYSFSESDVWYVKPIETSLIQPLRPSGIKADDDWNISFTAGEFSALVNGSVRRYWVPEFDKQSFQPYKPIRYSTYEKLLFVNKSVLSATRGSLKIDPDDNLHLNIFFYTFRGELAKALTTNGALNGTRFADTDVFWESGLIESWDNESGIISLSVGLPESYTYAAQYFYESQNYEYSLVNLNPVTNKDARKGSYVFYIIPDAHVDDRAIHFLRLNKEGIIVECSQSQGVLTPNLQVEDSGGNYNADTVIGLKYVSDVEFDNFLNRYAAGYGNTYGYSILAEVSTFDSGIEEYQTEIDVSRKGMSLELESLEEAIHANPWLAQSVYGFGEDGMPSPDDATYLIEAPLSMLREYGGDHSKESAEEALTRYLHSSVYPVVVWTYPSTEVEAVSTSLSQVDLTLYWEGPNLDYRIYRRENSTSAWSLIHTLSSPAEGALSYADTTVTSNEVYYYEVRIYDGAYEYPSKNSVSVEVV